MAMGFLSEELFARRKRKRTVADKYDRNVLSAFSAVPLRIPRPERRGRARPLHLLNAERR